MNKLQYIVIVLALLNGTNGVEVHFETPDSGFFLKHTRQQLSSNIDATKTNSALNLHSKIVPFDSVLSVDRFTVVEAVQPVSIRVSYGPFSTKQTVPARYVVPDALINQSDIVNNTTAALIELQQSNIQLDISAHLVRNYVSIESPVLRVLFHAGADPAGHFKRKKICVLLHVSLNQYEPLKGRCMPEGEDSVCLAEVLIPPNWWSPIYPFSTESVSKAPLRFLQASYSVFEPPLRNPEQCEPKVQIQPLTPFAKVSLLSTMNNFIEITSNGSLFSIFMPQQPLYPMSKLHIPVFIHKTENDLFMFSVKVRVKSGMKILGATMSSDAWNISLERENIKHTSAKITAMRKDMASSNNNTTDSRSTEILWWILQVSEEVNDLEDNGKMVWTLSTESSLNETKIKVVHKVDIHKDDIQAVLPMAKNWELMNTAVLTRRQVAQALKVFIVSQSGKVADVTLQSSCNAEDESIIKVSSSCSSVYVDGSEIRGSSNASVIVKYGTYIGVAKFIVWMPEFPLEIFLTDSRLSQIKGWKVLEENQNINHKKLNRRKRSYIWSQPGSNYMSNYGSEKGFCRARFQQSPVEVYARFIAHDQNSGRMNYFISRRSALRITDLVQPLLRVSDPKIATLKGKTLQGKSIGRTDVQVLSPITGRVIGTKEIRVGSDKVSLTKLVVRVVSGLQLMIIPDNTIENGYIAETLVTHRLTAQYQEGLLDIDIEFSDGSKTPLREISVDDYFLLVESLDTDVVAFAPMLASHHPRVIAVGEGNGNLLRVTLQLSEDCRGRRGHNSSKQSKYNYIPLATATSSVEVDFDNDNIKQEHIQNDGVLGRDRKSMQHNGDLSDIIVGIPLRDENKFNDEAMQISQKSNVNSIDKRRFYTKRREYMTSMEIGMYVLLIAFCFAIVVFVISCVVYASKFKYVTGHSPDSFDLKKTKMQTNFILKDNTLHVGKESTTNAHDWVWLGRSTMDKPAVQTSVDPRLTITYNPLSIYDNQGSHQTANGVVWKNNSIFSNDISPQSLNLQKCPTDYRPPVPPHRNIGIRAVIKMDDTASVEKPREIFEKTSELANYIHARSKTKDHVKHNAEKLVDSSQHNPNAFRFDSLVVNHEKADLSSSDRILQNNVCAKESSMSKTHKPLSAKHERIRSAAVVGNPMFSTLLDEESGVESLGLDELDMDYEQIMNYFDSLKESNA